jgi:hypothetical protein
VQSIVRDAWLPGIEVLTSHEHGDSDDGLFLAAKGGHNGESHNHNDIGSFIVGLDGRPLLIDVGVETYRKQTFSAQRYEIWTMQSGFHNLPTINGHDQLPGKEFGASDVQCTVTNERSALALDIAGAYGPEAGVVSWHRISTLYRGDDARIEVIDRYEMSQQPESLDWNLMTVRPAEETAPGVLRIDLDGRLLEIRFDADQLTATREEITIEDARLAPVWGDAVWRTRLTAKNPQPTGEVQVTFARG